MRQKVLSAVLAVLASFAVIGVANCGSTPAYDFSQLADASGLIVLGEVTDVKAKAELDRVTVKVVHVLKGALEVSEFRLQLMPRGLVGFDVALSKGSVGVFFLASAPTDGDEYAALTHGQGVALLNKDAFTVPN